MAYVSPSTRRSTASADPASRSVGGSSSTGRGPRPLPPRPSNGRGTFVAGLGVGILVGAAVALLLAPQSGADTRRALRRRGRRVRAKAGDAWDDLRWELARAKRALRRKRREGRHVDDPETRDA